MKKQTKREAIEAIVGDFLLFSYRGGSADISDVKDRHERIKATLMSCGDEFDAHDLLWLFMRLENRAVEEIGKLAALAQTTEPEQMKKHGLPTGLIDGAIGLKEHHIKETKCAGTAPARASKQDDKDRQAFKKWAIKAINQEADSGNIQTEDVRGMDGFEPSWGQVDNTLKRWVKEIFPGFTFKRGRRKGNK